jgi:Z1 domain/Type III restriction enzyme, res subunit
MDFDIRRFMGKRSASMEYQRQLERLKNEKKHTGCIEDAVDGATKNLRQKNHSFVIYGEPQSGKTEMMICLTAKLIDEGYHFILHLLNDSVDLLNQNLGRFSGSGLAPAAKHFSDILDPSVHIKGHQHVVFCKKNGNDLRKLLEKIGKIQNLVIIDDEADYASPNAKVNQGLRTPINDLMTELLSNKGIYIGVTATPARLDLNNTFDNDSSQWVTFPPHPAYTGQDTFFPLNKKIDKYSLQLIPDHGAGPEHARRALFGFLVNVAFLNKYVNDREQSYSFLIHTSGKKIDHKADREHIYKCLKELVERHSDNFKKYTEAIWHLAHERYPQSDPYRLTEYILDNIGRQKVLVLNSERDWKDNSAAATNPSALFTIIIGGNIVSRGVTFDNLLSMFFTRDVKHKIQQDTYIQRARMFGSRGSYLRYFELTIPNSLYDDWHRCFVFHRLALSAITEGLGSMVWLGDKRISAVASSSIDRSTVDLNRGEMSFSKFDWNDQLDSIVASSASVESKISKIVEIIGENAFPIYVRRYIKATSPSGDAQIAVHPSSLITGGDYDVDDIARRKGLMGKSQLEADKYPHAIHHIKIFRNSKGKARLFYKLSGSIQMIRNTANDS